MSAITGFFATIIGYPMQWIYSVVNNYGLSIIAITIIIRLCLLPLYTKQIKNSAKMSEIQPQIKEIQNKYARDRVKMNEEMNNLYAKAGVSPTSGCLPLLIQLPLIWGLFALLRNPITYMTKNPAMVAAVHEGFLWVEDLSQTDPWILPIIAAITTYFTSEVSMGTAGGQGGMAASMKYFMPIMIFIMGRSFPAGLTLYWTIGNCVIIVQTLIVNNRKKKKQAAEAAEAEVLKRMKKEGTL